MYSDITIIFEHSLFSLLGKKPTSSTFIEKKKYATKSMQLQVLEFHLACFKTLYKWHHRVRIYVSYLELPHTSSHNLVT